VVRSFQFSHSKRYLSVATIAILEQPVPQVVFKKRALDGAFTVRILTGAKVELGKVEHVETHMANDGAWKSVNPIQNGIVALELGKMQATLNDIRINDSTKVLPVQLKFACKVHAKNSKEKEGTVIHSPLSNPIIVITNESQWGEAGTNCLLQYLTNEAGKLLSSEIFGTMVSTKFSVHSCNQSEIPWHFYANMFHRFVLRALQDQKGGESSETRGFTEWELDYIHLKFFCTSSE
jgi:hypothetical protein